MATSSKTTKSRFSDPDMKFLGAEPMFDSTLGVDYEGRNIALLKALNWYNYFVSKKDLIPNILSYAKTELKLPATQLNQFKLACPTWANSTAGALVRMSDSRGFVLNDKEKTFIKDHIMRAVEEGSKIKEVKTSEDKPREVITPQQRLRNKVNVTIMEDLRVLEDAWLASLTEKFDAYALMKQHDLPAMSVGMVTPWVNDRIQEMQDAIDKSCPQAVEAFRHLDKKELVARVKLLNKVLDDLKRHQANSKTVRKVRTKKPVAATKLVAKIKFLKESPEFKLVSINPATVVGAARLFVFNVKTRTLSEYISSGPDGLSVKGTSLQNWDSAISKSTRLRKPEEFLPLVLSKTPKQIGNAWSKLTTKDASPNGRLNDDTILMRITNG